MLTFFELVCCIFLGLFQQRPRPFSLLQIRLVFLLPRRNQRWSSLGCLYRHNSKWMVYCLLPTTPCSTFPYRDQVETSRLLGRNRHRHFLLLRLVVYLPHHILWRFTGESFKRTWIFSYQYRGRSSRCIRRWNCWHQNQCQYSIWKHISRISSHRLMVLVYQLSIGNFLWSCPMVL